VHLDGNVQSTDIPNLSAVTAGALPPNPSELLGSEKMREILHVVGSQTEMILIDTPPILAVTDAMVLAPRVDGVLLIVKPGRTKLTACKQAVEQLHRVGARLLGVVLNDVRFNRSRFSYYNYQNFYYSYAELYGDSSSKEKVKKARRKQKS
jgi:capsular exopolysaccharide synthesis family protein